MAHSKTLTGPKGWRLTLDQSEVYLDDAGKGTPALVYTPDSYTATLWCVLGEGEVESRKVPHDVMAWLEGLESEVDEYLYEVESN